MFINCTNHPSNNWGNNQRKAAQKWGCIVDLPFPAVPADSTEAEVDYMASEIVDRIITLIKTGDGVISGAQESAVLCQGEFTLAYQIISRLLQVGIPLVAACSERKVEEICLNDGTVRKNSIYEFVQFRHYR